MKSRRAANQPPTRKAGCGCSGLGTLLLLLLIAGAIVGWPVYLDANGASASGLITEKHEGVRIRYGNWFRRFEIVAAYSVPGRFSHEAICDVDEKTYDSLHRGDKVTIHYFANLLTQPFLPATHISPCTAMASISLNPAIMRNLVIALISLLAILFVWRVLRIRIAAWLLLPWFCLAFVYFVMPRAEPEPQRPVPAMATVDSVAMITTVGGMEEDRDIPLPHPYQIVRVKFVPPGFDAPVTAIDKVDAGSVPNLKEGQSVSIVYDAGHPRVIRLQGGTRRFPGQARIVVVALCLVFVLLVSILAVIRGFFHLINRNSFIQAARANPAFRRRFRR